MIIKGEAIEQPQSGTYDEKIYDPPSNWKSGDWTYIKFEEENSIEWCGVFRGRLRGLAITDRSPFFLLLTSDFLYKIDRLQGKIVEYEAQPFYKQLTVSSTGQFVLASSYDIDVIEPDLSMIYEIISPMSIDLIQFENWVDDKLLISCQELLNWDNKVYLILDTQRLTLRRLEKGSE